MEVILAWFFDVFYMYKSAYDSDTYIDHVQAWVVNRVDSDKLNWSMKRGGTRF